MRILLDNEELSLERFDNLNATKILEELREDMEEEIISEIYVDDIQITEDELKKVDLEKVESIKFITKKSILLVKETLEQANDYLPRLKEGFNDTGQLLRTGEIMSANDKLQFCLDGVEWYTSVLVKILSLLYGDNKDKEEIKEVKKIEELNVNITKVLKGMEENNLDDVADVLDNKIINDIDEFMDINDDLLELINSQ